MREDREDIASLLLSLTKKCKHFFVSLATPNIPVAPGTGARRFEAESSEQVNSRPNGLLFTWRRGEDSNLRWVAPHYFSRVAP